ncbi:MAG: hypothetical protein HY318_15050 [Armatimonadetes bacterium]|nr:hypothetical protein [Armatimonadota bacterium]
MLADLPTLAQAGRFEPEVHLPGAARDALLDFIADELPCWRDHPERKPETAETALTGQLCDHLNSAARTSAGWSWVQFRTEVPDEVRQERTIDLAPKPCGAVLIIEGRRHTQFHTLFPIECKRLPTPTGRNRDKREYVVTATGTTGGMQRLKFGYHGAAHQFGAMIAYVQEQTFPHWLSQVNGWICDLSAECNSAWSDSDALQPLKDDCAVGICIFHSRHQRGGGLEEIELRHLWINMN